MVGGVEDGVVAACVSSIQAWRSACAARWLGVRMDGGSAGEGLGDREGKPGDRGWSLAHRSFIRWRGAEIRVGTGMRHARRRAEGS